MVGIGGIFFLSVQFAYSCLSGSNKNILMLPQLGKSGYLVYFQIPNIDYYVTGYGELGVKAVLEGNPIYRDFRCSHTCSRSKR